MSSRSCFRCSQAIQSASLDRLAELRLAAEPDDERDVVELDVEAGAQLCQVAQELELRLAVAAVARRAPFRHDEPRGLEVPEHPRRPPGAPRSLADGVRHA